MRLLPIVTLFVLSCDPPPPFPPNIERNTAVDVTYCGAASNNLFMLGCEEGKPSKKGVTFDQLCNDLSLKGMFINARCLSEIKSCKGVNACTGSSAK